MKKTKNELQNQKCKLSEKSKDFINGIFLNKTLDYPTENLAISLLFSTSSFYKGILAMQ